MDLIPEYSFAKKLESCGMSPYLLEWNDPSYEISHYSEAEYIENILIPIIDYISAQHNRKIIILGHCLGGVMALAATQILQTKIAGLITVATPWNFHHSSFIYKANHKIYSLILNNSNGIYIPKELIHMMMNWPHINTTIDKLISISYSEQIDELFFAVENWLDDNVNMTIPLFKSCIMKYAIYNQTYNLEWSVLGEIIDPKRISAPTLNIIPTKDKVVPQKSSEPLSSLFPNCKTLNLDTGHIGMLITRNYDFALTISEWAKNYVK
jgi:polyhydroxyalkanoate synthase